MSESCVFRSGRCIFQSGSGVFVSDTCVFRSGACVFASESCVFRSDPCVSSSVSCVFVSEGAVSSSESCVFASESHKIAAIKRKLSADLQVMKIKIVFSVFAVALACLTFPHSGAAQKSAVRKTSQKPRKRTFIEVASIPTPPETVAKMLELANLKKGDVLYDLGSGDGRIPLEAARKYGVRAIGIEIKPKLVEEANRRAKEEGIAQLAKFLQADLFRMSYKDADVVTLYLSDELNLRILPRLLRDLRPGAKIISHDFIMGDWKPDISVKVPWKNLYRNVHVWTIPKDKNIKNLTRN